MNMSKPLVVERRKAGMYLELNEFFISFVKSTIKSDYIQNFSLISNLLHLLDMSSELRNHKDYVGFLNFYSGDSRLSLKEDLVKLQETIDTDMSIFKKFILNKEETIERNAGISYATYNSETNQYEIVVKGLIDKNTSILNQLRYLLSNSYIDMFFYTMSILPGNRFGVCPKCESPFFALTRRPKMYCGVRCAKMESQRIYMTKKNIGLKND